MSRRNTGNFTTLKSVLLDHLEVQSSGPALLIYSNDSSIPVYTFDPSAKQATIVGNLTVTGESTFDNITIRDVEGGLLNIGHSNTADMIDLGINAMYVNNNIKTFTGIVREASDILKRWTFYEYVTTAPITNIQTITEALLASTRQNKIFMNDGTALLPSIAFDGDFMLDTGFYRIVENSIGITAGGKIIAAISRLSATASTFVLNLDTQLQFLKINTIDDSVQSNNITTGHIYLKSESASDKWLKLYSNTTATVPAYAGLVLTSPAQHYFTTNTGSAMQIFGRVNNNDVETLAPDYRATNALLLSVSLTYTETKLPLIIPLGTLNNLSLQFSNENTTGLFRSGVNALGIVTAATIIINVSATNVTFTRNTYNIDGTVVLPAISFTNSTSTGLYSSATNVLNVTTAGVNRVTFKATGTDFTTGSVINIGTSGTTSVLNTYGTVALSDGSAATPALTFIAEPGQNSGVYRIGTANIGISTGGVKQLDISNVLTQITNDFQTLQGYRKSVTIVAISLQLTTAHNIVEVSAATAVTITLPSITGNTGREYIIIRIGTGIVTINTNTTTQYIDNMSTTSVTLNNIYDRATLVCGSTQWYSL